MALLILALLQRIFLMSSLMLLRSEERFSRNAETDLVCRLLLEKKKQINQIQNSVITNIYSHFGSIVLHRVPRELFISHTLICTSYFFFLMLRLPPISTLFPYTTLFRSRLVLRLT